MEGLGDDRDGRLQPLGFFWVRGIVSGVAWRSI